MFGGGCMMVGLLATPALYFFQAPPLLVVGPLVLWLVGFALLAVIIVLADREIFTGYAKIDWLISAFVSVGQLYKQRRSFTELFVCAATQLLLVATTFLLLSRAMAMPMEPVFICLFIPFIFFIASLPVFYMGWGGREAVVIMTLGTRRIFRSQSRWRSRPPTASSSPLCPHPERPFGSCTDQIRKRATHQPTGDG